MASQKESLLTRPPEVLDTGTCEKEATRVDKKLRGHSMEELVGQQGER